MNDLDNAASHISKAQLYREQAATLADEEDPEWIARDQLADAEIEAAISDLKKELGV